MTFTISNRLLWVARGGDPDLTVTVPRNQYFYTGIDAYIHCFEALSGSYRNAIGDALSEQAIKICREVFMSNNMMSDENRAKIMVASYLGGVRLRRVMLGLFIRFQRD